LQGSLGQVDPRGVEELFRGDVEHGFGDQQEVG